MKVNELVEYARGVLDCDSGITPKSENKFYQLGYGEMYQALELDSELVDIEVNLHMDKPNIQTDCKSKSAPNQLEFNF